MTYSQSLNPNGFISASPLPSMGELRKFYAEMYYQSPQSSSYQESYPDWEIKHKKYKSSILLKALAEASGRPFRKGIDRYVDIGCGEGFVLNAASAHEICVQGFDFSEYGIKKFHPELLCCFEAGDAMSILRRLSEEGALFDYCSTINVLEHVIDPVGFLQAVFAITTAGGTIAVTVPNDFSSLQSRLRELNFVTRDFWFAPPAHLHYFNTVNLPLFLESQGFEVVDMYSDFPVDLFLLHPGSNYIEDPKNGPAAHRARVEADLFLAESGDESYLNLCRAMAKCGIGRDFTVILRRAND